MFVEHKFSRYTSIKPVLGLNKQVCGQSLSLIIVALVIGDEPFFPPAVFKIIKFT